MSISYSGLTNYGKVSLPSIEGWSTNLNILKDPPRSVMTRRIDKVGSTSAFNATVDSAGSGDRITEAILHYPRGINPMASVSYSNNGNNGGQGFNGSGNAGGGVQASLPYKIMTDGAFRPPIRTPYDLLPLSRLPRLPTSVPATKSFQDYSKSRQTCLAKDQERAVKKLTLKTSIRPTKTLRLDKPAEAPYEVKYVIKNPIKVKGVSGVRTLDVKQQNNQVPVKGASNEIRQINIRSNSGGNSQFYKNSKATHFNPKRYLQNTLHSNVSSHKSGVINSKDASQLISHAVRTQKPCNVSYDTVKTVEFNKNNYIHKDVELSRNLPQHEAMSSKTSRANYINPSLDTKAKLKPATRRYQNARSNLSGIEEVNHTSRCYQLPEKLQIGGIEPTPTLPVFGRNTKSSQQAIKQNYEANRDVLYSIRKDR